MRFAEPSQKRDDICPNKSTLLRGYATETIDCDDRLVMKLFSPEWPRRLIEDEMKINNLIVDKGIRTPRIKEIREYEGKLGLVYDKIPGVTFLEWLLRNPESVKTLSMDFALVQHEIHGYRVPELVSLREGLLRAIEESKLIPNEFRNPALRILDGLPDGEALCHGDYHPDNVILTSSRTAIIDWIRATKGCYLADVARSCLLLKIWLPHRIKVMGRSLPSRIIEEFYEVYVSEYLGLCGKSREDLDEWSVPIAAARLADEGPGERQALLKAIRAGI